jgi:hypothetical protein
MRPHPAVYPGQTSTGSGACRLPAGRLGFSYDRALVVGSGVVGPADEQGTPVQLRDGPAAVTVQDPRNFLC